MLTQESTTQVQAKPPVSTSTANLLSQLSRFLIKYRTDTFPTESMQRSTTPPYITADPDMMSTIVTREPNKSITPRPSSLRTVGFTVEQGDDAELAGFMATQAANAARSSKLQSELENAIAAARLSPTEFLLNSAQINPDAIFAITDCLLALTTLERDIRLNPNIDLKQALLNYLTLIVQSLHPLRETVSQFDKIIIDAQTISEHLKELKPIEAGKVLISPRLTKLKLEIDNCGRTLRLEGVPLAATVYLLVSEIYISIADDCNPTTVPKTNYIGSEQFVKDLRSLQDFLNKNQNAATIKHMIASLKYPLENLAYHDPAQRPAIIAAIQQREAQQSLAEQRRQAQAAAATAQNRGFLCLFGGAGEDAVPVAASTSATAHGAAKSICTIF